MKTNQYLIDFYNTYDEDSRLTLRHGTVEFLTTMRYIEKYINSGNHVLEIGAGTGRYSHALARQGYAVDAVELVSHNIEVFRKNTLPNEDITVIQGNALDLSSISDNKYDITLLLGPLYHLYNSEDKKQAIREAVRVTKQGGIIFAAKSEEKDLFELVRKEDIDELMSEFPTIRLHYVAADGCSLLMREAIDKMDDDTFDLYLKYHFATCERGDLAGITSHAIDIFKK